MKSACIYSTLLFGLSCGIQAAEIDLKTGIGHDSNPFRLTDSLPVNADTYWHQAVRIDLGKDTSWIGQLNLRRNIYQDIDAADHRTIDARAGYKGTFSDGVHDYRLSLAYRDQDKSYVSRFSGLPYAVGGTSASDRYDFSRWHPRADVNFQIAKGQTLQVRLEHRDIDYEDYLDLGLTDLDYHQTGVRLGWKHRLNREFRYELFSDVQHREYENRLAKDDRGNNISDKHSQYRYLTLGAKMRYRLARQTYVYLGLKMIDRNDNGGGYYDTETYRGSVLLRRILPTKSEWSLSLRYSDLNYDRKDTNGDLENDAETPSTDGFGAVARYTRPLFTLGDAPVEGYVQLNYDDYDAEIDAYAYDRTRFESGLKVTF